MPIDEAAEKAAKTELDEIQGKWKKIIATLRDIEVKPREDQGYRHQLWQEKDGFKYRLERFISMESYREALAIFEGIYTDLDLALRKGQENYEQGKHKRRIEWARTLGLGAIILVIILFGIKLLFNIEVQFPW
jgi:hypothetical protein